MYLQYVLIKIINRDMALCVVRTIRKEKIPLQNSL